MGNQHHGFRHDALAAAAEVLSQGNVQVDVYDAMPSLGRKFLRAGIGGLNITHSENYASFCSRYGERRPQLQAMLDATASWEQDVIRCSSTP